MTGASGDAIVRLYRAHCVERKTPQQAQIIRSIQAAPT
jgi:hypothetical protein